MASAHAPVVAVDVVHDGRHVIARDAERAQPLDNRGVQLALRVQRAASEAVDGDDRPILRKLEIWGVGEAMRLVNDQPDVAVLRRYPERLDQRVVDCVDDAISSSAEYWRRTSIRAAGIASLS